MAGCLAEAVITECDDSLGVAPRLGRGALA